MHHREHNSQALRYGMRSQWMSQFYLQTPRSSANRMNQTCLFLASQSWSWFTNAVQMEGWVVPGCLVGYIPKNKMSSTGKWTWKWSPISVLTVSVSEKSRPTMASAQNDVPFPSHMLIASLQLINFVYRNLLFFTKCHCHALQTLQLYLHGQTVTVVIFHLPSSAIFLPLWNDLEMPRNLTHKQTTQEFNTNACYQ